MSGMMVWQRYLRDDKVLNVALRLEERLAPRARWNSTMGVAGILDGCGGDR